MMLDESADLKGIVAAMFIQILGRMPSKHGFAERGEKRLVDLREQTDRGYQGMRATMIRGYYPGTWTKPLNTGTGLKMLYQTADVRTEMN